MPAFGGAPRELVAEDYVYSIKRHFDPRWRSSSLGTFEEYLAGLPALRAQALKSGRFERIGRYPLFQSHLRRLRLARLVPPFLRLCALLRRLHRVLLRDWE